MWFKIGLVFSIVGLIAPIPGPFDGPFDFTGYAMMAYHMFQVLKNVG